MTANSTFPARRRRHSYLTAGTLAGLAGGMMEIVWIMLYSSLSGNDAAIVARGVTASVFPDLASAPSSVAVGLMIHMSLAIGLGIVIAMAIPAVLPRVAGTIFEPILVVASLAAVWTVNFFVLLPIINNDFVTIVPFAVSFTSKLLFGFASALVFWVMRGKPAKDN